ncbi:hypothetical protein K1T71_004936 [Dendrolimus kikuchii]|uniref:Uncharacterized protein n=1 Tax=Dendrolimus kikuchii TaxID=765133 RepID=A0ACC1D5J1_9NEOP|nr:hypothetical protein K1T71_004936 [Dendrolimus kikuchii]
MILLALVTVFVTLIIFSWIYYNRDMKKHNIPGSSPLPIIGNALDLLGDTAKFMRTLKKYTDNYGGIYRVYLFSSLYVVVNHPKYMEPILSSSDLIVKGKSYDFARPWLGDGILTTTGHKWRTHRKFLTPAFHFNILQNFLPVFCKNEKILIKKLSQLVGKNINLFPIIALTALDNVTESIMGVALNVQTNSESKYVNAVDAMSKIVIMRMKNPVLGENAIFNLLPYKRSQDNALKVIHGQSKRVIKARREELNRLNTTSLPDTSEYGIKNRHAFLDLLLLAEVEGKRLDDESVREEVDTFMFEGHDTTTSGLVFSLYCLAKHKEVQEKIYTELKEIFGDDLNRDPTYTELQQMKYLELVIKETLRLYPSVPLIERKITHDCNIAGSHVPKNTSLIIDIFHMQRNPEVYENPLDFIPERFEKPLKSPFAWVPFSAGPRNCIGQRFALMEMKVTIAAVIKNFEILPVDIEPLLSIELILRSSNGVHVKLQPRNQTA